jgi:beta-galactosidase
VTARVVDANGVLCPNADNPIKFSMTGPGQVAAVDNGDVNSHEAYQASQRKVYRGECVAIVKAKSTGGGITLKASAPGLADGTVTIDTGAKVTQ